MEKIIFYGESEKLFFSYKKILENHGYLCFFVDNLNDTYFLLKENDIDIIFADYTLFDHSLYNVYNEIKKNNKNLFLFFINEPGFEYNLLSRWEEIILCHYPHISVNKVKKIFALFEKNYATLGTIVVKDGGTSYIPLSEHISLSEKNSENEEVPLHYVESCILDLLFTSMETPVSLEMMAKAIDCVMDTKCKNRLYGYIHNIKLHLKEQCLDTYELVRCGKGAYKLIKTKALP